jgi:parvulin-like peptidyl-prolyl isomerase
MAELQKPLIEGYGLNVLLNMVQLDLARQNAAKQHITVSAADVEKERDQTLAKMFKDAKQEDYPQLMEQFLQQQRISRPEFDMVMETNAILRKIAEPQLAGKISDENLVSAFNTLYGETVQIRHIQVANLQEIAEAQRRLAAGEQFAEVAKAMSRNQRTAGLGGELPTFSMQTAGLPESFKRAAFDLKEGEVSEPVQADGAYHLIKLEHRFAPKAVKFEDMKESVREEVYDRLMQQAIKELRSRLGRQAIETLKIEDPVLKKQYDEKLAAGRAQIKDREQINKALERQRDSGSTTHPSTLPSLGPETPTAESEEAVSPERPPATQPGAAPGNTP